MSKKPITNKTKSNSILEKFSPDKVFFGNVFVSDFFKEFRKNLFFLKTIKNNEIEGSDEVKEYENIVYFFKNFRLVKNKQTKKIYFQIFDDSTSKFISIENKLLKQDILSHKFIPFAKNNLTKTIYTQYIFKPLFKKTIFNLNKTLKTENFINFTVEDFIKLSIPELKEKEKKEITLNVQFKSEIKKVINSVEACFVAIGSPDDKISAIKKNKLYTKKVWNMFDSEIRSFVFNIFRNEFLDFEKFLWVSDNLDLLKDIKNKTNSYLLMNLYFRYKKTEVFQVNESISEDILQKPPYLNVNQIQALPKWAHGIIAYNVKKDCNSNIVPKNLNKSKQFYKNLLDIIAFVDCLQIDENSKYKFIKNFHLINRINDMIYLKNTTFFDSPKPSQSPQLFLIESIFTEVNVADCALLDETKEVLNFYTSIYKHSFIEKASNKFNKISSFKNPVFKKSIKTFFDSISVDLNHCFYFFSSLKPSDFHSMITYNNFFKDGCWVDQSVNNFKIIHDKIKLSNICLVGNSTIKKNNNKL